MGVDNSKNLSKNKPKTLLFTDNKVSDEASTMIQKDDMPSLKSVIDRAYNKIDLNKKYENQETLLLIATKMQNVNAIKILLTKKIDIDAQNVADVAALHIAARNCNTDITKELLKYGAKIDIKDLEGFTPIMRSAAFMCLEVFEMLFNSGASIKTKNVYGQNVIDIISDSQNIEVKNKMMNIINKQY